MVNTDLFRMMDDSDTTNSAGSTITSNHSLIAIIVGWVCRRSVQNISINKTKRLSCQMAYCMGDVCQKIMENL